MSCRLLSVDTPEPCGYLGRVRIPAHIRAVRPFLAMELMERALEMERDGTRVIHLEVGEPDFAPPPAALAACADALHAGQTNYTDSRGLPDLRSAIAADKSRRTGVSVDPARVIVTSGTSPAMLMVFGLLLEPGDEMIVPSPHYSCYPNFVRFCGGTPLEIACDPAAGYAVDVDAVRAALTPRTRGHSARTPSRSPTICSSGLTSRSLPGSISGRPARAGCASATPRPRPTCERHWPGCRAVSPSRGTPGDG